MSQRPWPANGGLGAGLHPVVVSRRLRDLAVVSLGALIPVALALVVAAETPNPQPLSILIIMIATLGVFALVVSSRITITVAALGLYLGLLDGPVKLGHPGHFTSALRDAHMFDPYNGPAIIMNRAAPFRPAGVLDMSVESFGSRTTTVEIVGFVAATHPASASAAPFAAT